VTLPALRITMGDLVAEVAHQCGCSVNLVSYEPDPELEAAFAAQPRLSTPAAVRAGFGHDGTLEALVGSALATL
jgi:D-erythronate 2-dehydrogenase